MRMILQAAPQAVDLGAVVRMHGVQPAARLAFERFGAAAPDRGIGRADVFERARRHREHPEHVLDVVGQLAKALLAVAQRALGLAHAQQRVDVGDQFVGLDRRRQVVVGAAFQAADLVGAPGQRGRGLQHQHHRAVGVGLDAAADLDAVDVGELDVQQDQRILRA
jgi:hypothetical protein